MIDINELRRLAQAATPGRWYVEGGNYIYGCKEVIDGEEEWHPVIACTDDDEVSVNFAGNAKFVAAANPVVVSELLDRLEAAEKDIALKERIIDALWATLNSVAKKRDELRVRIEAMEQQEPVAWMLNCPTLGGDTGWILSWTQSGAGQCNRLSGEENERKLYLAPGAKGE